MAQPKTISLPRRQASAKLRAATKATYVFQVKGGACYEREVPIEEVIASFDGDPGMRMRITLEDSAHTIVVPSSTARIFYRIEF